MNNARNRKSIVCIGGGTGTFVALRGLKHYTHRLSAIVSMADSGGSNKRIRDEFGLLPTSDLRQCLVALSDENGGVGLLRKLFMYRFEKGEGISGMTFGNLFMAALADILGSQEEAIAQTSRVLRIKGSVIPVTFTDTNLHAEYEDGHTAAEEHVIDMPHHDGKVHIKRIWLSPRAKANPEALSALGQADLIVLGPGDLYTSLLPNLLVDGIASALKQTRARKVYVANLMTKWGQTYDYTLSDHLRAIEEIIGPCIDIALVNDGRIPKKALDFYAQYHEQPVEHDLTREKRIRVVTADLVNSTLIQKTKADALVRSLIRHDSGKLARALISLIQ